MSNDDWMSDAALYPDRKSVALVPKSQVDALTAEVVDLKEAVAYLQGIVNDSSEEDRLTAHTYGEDMSETDAFEQAALQYFRENVPIGYVQRVDGIACFSPLSKFWFWKRRLVRLAQRGVLRRVVTGCGLTAYGLPKAPFQTPTPTQPAPEKGGE